MKKKKGILYADDLKKEISKILQGMIVEFNKMFDDFIITIDKDFSRINEIQDFSTHLHMRMDTLIRRSNFLIKNHRQLMKEAVYYDQL